MARVPLYKAAETEMLRRINDGEWEVGLRLPNEFGLADEFGVSQGTMRRALMSLEGMGLLTRKPGRGTIVAEPALNTEAPEAVAAGFTRVLASDGEALALEVFRARTTTRGAESLEATLFGTGRLSVLERTLKRGSTRFALEEIVAPEATVPAFDEDGDTEFAPLLEALGLRVASISDRVTADITTMSESVVLSVDRHTPLLVLTRVARDAAGAPIAKQSLKLVADDIGYDIILSR